MEFQGISLTHEGSKKMAAILQMTYKNLFTSVTLENKVEHEIWIKQNNFHTKCENYCNLIQISLTFFCRD